MEHLTRSQAITLKLGNDVAQSASPFMWTVVHPSLITADPSADGRSAVVRVLPGVKLGMGRQTVKVINSLGQGVAYFSLAISEDPKPVAPPVVAEAVVEVETGAA